MVFLCSINHRTVIGHPHDASQAEGTAEDILGQPTQPCDVVRRDVHAVINTEAGVLPASHLLGRLWIELALSDKQLEDVFLPNLEQQLLVDPRQAQERAVRGEDAVSGNSMDVRMEVDEFSESLNAGDHAGDDIATTEHLPINLNGGLPSGAGQFAEQPAVVATVDP